MKQLIFVLLLFPFFTSAQMQFMTTTNRTSASDDFEIVNNSVKGTDGYEHSYVGTWQDFSASGFYDGDGSYSGIAGDSIIFRFNGTKIEWYTERKTTLGKANVSLDGGAYTEVDLYAADTVQQVLKYSSGTISQAVHTLVIKVLHEKNASSTNYYVNHDYFKVYNPLPVPIPPAPDSFPWYVETAANGGSDANPCTEASPCLTVKYVNDNIAQDGDTIHIGIGTFVEAPILPGHGVSFVGSGINQTTLKLDPAYYYTLVTSPLDFGDDDYLFQYISGAGDQYMSDLTLDGTSRAAHGGVYLSTVDSVTFERLIIKDFGFTGMWLKDTEADTVKDVSFSNSSYSGTFSSAPLMIGGATADDILIDGVTVDELSVGEIRGYTFKVMGPSPTSPTISNIKLIDFNGTTSATSNYSGGTPNLGIEMHNTTMTDVLIQGGSSNATMSLVRPDGQSTNPGTHSVTVDGHNIINPSGGANAGIELSFFNATIKNCYIKGTKFAHIFNTTTLGNGPAASGWFINNNVFEDTFTSGGQAGVVRSTWNGLDSVYFYNNTIYQSSGNTGAKIFVTFNGANSDKIYMTNNLVIDEENTVVWQLNGGGAVTNSTVTYNQLFGLTEGAQSGVTYSNNLTTDPQINATGFKPDPYYRPSSSGSPVFESGTDVGLDFNGAAPTRGAFEISIE